MLLRLPTIHSFELFEKTFKDEELYMLEGVFCGMPVITRPLSAKQFSNFLCFFLKFFSKFLPFLQNEFFF